MSDWIGANEHPWVEAEYRAAQNLRREETGDALPPFRERCVGRHRCAECAAVVCTTHHRRASLALLVAVCRDTCATARLLAPAGGT